MNSTNILKRLQILKSQNVGVVSSVGNALYSLVLVFSCSKADKLQNGFLLSNLLLNTHRSDDKNCLYNIINDILSSEISNKCCTKGTYRCSENKNTTFIMKLLNWTHILKAFKILVIRVLLNELMLLFICSYLQSIVSFSPLVLFSRWRNKIS